mmetsp:Transcript_11146/g.36835  ORF Transcript_11146/g.36835 Transcript_11146/m.36835 type:complete len:97 (-) Transcript_11146:165-455(-)
MTRLRQISTPPLCGESSLTNLRSKFVLLSEGLKTKCDVICSSGPVPSTMDDDKEVLSIIASGFVIDEAAFGCVLWLLTHRCGPRHVEIVFLLRPGQ